MSTRLRIKIGNAVISALESESTIAGTRAAFGDGLSSFTVETSPESVRIPLRIHVAGANDIEMLDRVGDVLDLLDAMDTDGVTLEMDDGIEVVSIARADVRSIRYETSRFVGTEGTILDVSIVVEMFDSDIVDGRGTWQYQRNASGRAMVIARLSAVSRAEVVALAAALKSGATRPAWLSSVFKPIEDTNDFDYTGDGLAQESSYAPATIVVLFEQLPAWAASDTAFADVVRMEVSFEAVRRPDLDIRAGNAPALDVSIAGRLTFKTENNTAYDATDTGTVQSSALRGKALACVNVMMTEAAKRLGVDTLTPIGPLDSFITGEDGIYQFAVPFISGPATQVIEWEEDESYDRVSQDVIVDIYDGSNWEFEHPGGFAEMVTHTLDVVSLGFARGYVRPQSLNNGTFKLMRDVSKLPKILRTGENGVLKFRSHFEREYRRIRGARSGGLGAHIITAEGTPSGFTA